MSTPDYRLEAERDFLLARLVDGDSRWVGRSSNAMVAAAIRGTGVDFFSYPHDDGDLGRCEETYKRAPEHLRPALLTILGRFREHVRRDRETGGYCPACLRPTHSWWRVEWCEFPVCQACLDERETA